jgi:predicted nuclease of predicted toxin-antitoxin system
MRFLVDMNLSPRWVDFLAAAGHEAAHSTDVGEPNAPDRVILEHAHRNRQVILTQDLDFGTLLAVGGLATPSVIQFRAQAVLPSDLGEQLLAALDVARTHLEAGALVTVDPVAHRVTVLPISMGGA